MVTTTSRQVHKSSVAALEGFSERVILGPGLMLRGRAGGPYVLEAFVDGGVATVGSYATAAAAWAAIDEFEAA